MSVIYPLPLSNETEWEKDISGKTDFSDDGLTVSEKEYWEKYYEHPDFSYEWNNGILEAKPMTDRDSYLMYKWFLLLLEHFLSARPVAETIGLEMGFRLALPGKTSVRKPDLGVVLHNNPIPLNPKDFTYSGVFDLCIESLSHSALREITRDTVTKKKEYARAGVREYYILDDRGIETAFYRRNKKGNYINIPMSEGDIIRSEVLPGFQFRVSDLYRKPRFEKIIKDEVYRDYLLLYYQESIQRVEEAEKRAEEERLQKEQAEKKAELERQRADMLAAKLRDLGISLE